MSRIIAITGGIGAGKSIVSRMLRAIGHDVYDCDSEAKHIMDTSAEIKQLIANEICAEAIEEGMINRQRLAEAVFADAALLDRLNAIVHAHVRADIERWASTKEIAFVETAILYQSGLDRMVHEVWHVDAPEAVRTERVMARSGLTAEQVKSRIEAQDAYEVTTPHPHIYLIINDGTLPVLPRVEELLSCIPG